MLDRKSGGLAWRERGQGETIVFLHGLGGSRTAWDPQLIGLGGNYRCVAWDMPGYGESDPVRPLTYAAIAAAVVRLLDELGTDRAHLVGESFGGMHALHTAIGYPDRVTSLILTNTSPAFGMDGTTAEGWRAARLAPSMPGLPWPISLRRS